MTAHNPMPTEREGVTHKFNVAGLEGYITVGLYSSGQPGEIFLTVKQEGTVERGMCHAWAVMASVALQHGVPLEKIVEKMRGIVFEPAGLTKNRDIPTARSLMDYLARWLELRFLTPNEKESK